MRSGLTVNSLLTAFWYQNKSDIEISSISVITMENKLQTALEVLVVVMFTLYLEILPRL
jgi:hypothetical protein